MDAPLDMKVASKSRTKQNYLYDNKVEKCIPRKKPYRDSADARLINTNKLWKSIFISLFKFFFHQSSLRVQSGFYILISTKVRVITLCNNLIAYKKLSHCVASVSLIVCIYLFYQLYQHCGTNLR